MYIFIVYATQSLGALARVCTVCVPFHCMQIITSSMNTVCMSVYMLEILFEYTLIEDKGVH